MKTAQEILDRIESCERSVKANAESIAALPRGDVRRTLIRNADEESYKTIMVLKWVLTGKAFGEPNRKKIRQGEQA